MHEKYIIENNLTDDYHLWLKQQNKEQSLLTVEEFVLNTKLNFIDWLIKDCEKKKEKIESIESDLISFEYEVDELSENITDLENDIDELKLKHIGGKYISVHDELKLKELKRIFEKCSLNELTNI
jgi:septal ring factor EnvC (AmiA/AmiB activator)